MRTVDAEKITKAVRELCIDANVHLPKDVCKAIDFSIEHEDYLPAKNTLELLVANYQLAAKNQVAICQDTGLACVFIEIGQEVFVEGCLEDAINEGVRQGYKDGYLRNSCVADPLRRVNTKDNTPAMIYYDIVKGDGLKITVAPKGFGSENMSAIKMLVPADGIEGIKKFVVETVKNAGPNPCPPIIVGVGIGGTFDKAALLAKKALLVDVNETNPDPFYEKLEHDLLEEVNALGIGPQGFGGKTTALGVNVLAMPTHIAGMPCAVNINCHVTRHKSKEL
ncbi:MAG: fumarate hydratase [Oscillospiraceae bacterium]